MDNFQGVFTVKCHSCGDLNAPFDNDHTSIKILFERGSPNIMDRIIFYCENCGTKREAAIVWPLEISATQPMTKWL